MNADELRQHARDLVADWPPLTEKQQACVTALLKTPVPAAEKLTEHRRAA